MPGEVNVISHPLVQHKLSLLRQKGLSTATFRGLVSEISMLLAYEVCRDFPTSKIAIETPVAPMQAPVLDGKKIVIVSILRAGTGILDGMLKILPSARVGHGHEHPAAVVRIGTPLDEPALDQPVDAVRHRAAGDEGLL